MKHPNQSTLALHAGGDLGLIGRWRTERHLAGCERCRAEVEAFQSTREILPELGQIPDIAWNRLAAEMRANIRLGLAAGECVRTGERTLRQNPLFGTGRVAVAVASMAALLVAGVFLERPTPASAKEPMVLQPIAGGIQVREGGRAFRLMNSGAQNVKFSVSAQGSLRARYVDPQTGYVTINDVYAE